MTEREYRDWLIEEIITDRTAWCERCKMKKETLKKKPTRVLERIYDCAE